MWHSGSISTYKAHVWLYPDRGIGIFAALAGPQRYDTTDVFYELMHTISDLVVFDVHPPSHEYTPATPCPDTADRGGVPGVRGGVPPRPLMDYTGTYVGQWLGMNATVTAAQRTGSLRLTLGRMLTADLRRYDCAVDGFDAVIGGRLWWVAEGLPQRAVLSVRFRASTPHGPPDVIELPLEMDENALIIRRYRFTRPGLKLADDWTPPPGHDNTCTAARTIGPQAWMFVPVVFRLFIF